MSGSEPFARAAGGPLDPAITAAASDPDVPPEERKRNIAVQLTVIARQLWRDFDQSVERAGLSRAKWRLIASVSRHPGATQRLVAELLEVSEVSAGRLIDRLCADGYLERRENPNDRRTNCVYLLPAAQPVLDQLSRLASTHSSEALDNLSEEDLVKLESLLATIAGNISRAMARARLEPVFDVAPLECERPSSGQ